MNVIQYMQYHWISWNARLTARELSPARTSTQWKAQTIKGVVMGGDSEDMAGNFKAIERPRKMDISVALPAYLSTCKEIQGEGKELVLGADGLGLPCEARNSPPRVSLRYRKLALSFLFLGN